MKGYKCDTCGNFYNGEPRTVALCYDLNGKAHLQVIGDLCPYCEDVFKVYFTSELMKITAERHADGSEHD